MILENLVLAALAVARAAPAPVESVIAVAHLSTSDLIDWFRERMPKDTPQASGLVPFTLIESSTPDRTSILQGIFDTNKSVVVDARRVIAYSIDEQLKGVHGDNRLAIYQ